MIEIFVCLGILLFTKVLEWIWTGIKVCAILIKFLITLPFELIKPSKAPKKSRTAQISRSRYRDPIEKMEDHWDNHPEDLDLEDIFWLDELAGDD